MNIQGWVGLCRVTRGSARRGHAPPCPLRVTPGPVSSVGYRPWPQGGVSGQTLEAHRSAGRAALETPRSVEDRRPPKILGTALRRGDQFTSAVSAEGVLEAGREDLFEREIVVGRFKRTIRVDYRDPHEDGHGDGDR